MSLLPKNENKDLQCLSDNYGAFLDDLPLEEISILPKGEKPAITEILPILAHMFEVDISGMPEDKQRNLIQNALLIHRRKGTVWALKKVLEKDGKAELIEWFDYGGEPYHFKVDFSASDYEITPQFLEKLRQDIEKDKNLRSKLEEILLSYLVELEFGIATGTLCEIETSAESDNFFETTAYYLNTIKMGTVGEMEASAVMTEIQLS
jgi:phage tail P2-like protein